MTGFARLASNGVCSMLRAFLPPTTCKGLEKEVCEETQRSQTSEENSLGTLGVFFAPSASESFIPLKQRHGDKSKPEQ